MIGIVGLWAALALGPNVDDLTKLEFGKEYGHRKFLGTGEFLDLKYTFTRVGSATQMEYQLCGTECEGGKHPKHSDCKDNACDKKRVCSRYSSHGKFMVPVLVPLGQDGNPVSRDTFIQRMDRVLDAERLTLRGESVFGNMSRELYKHSFEELKAFTLEAPCWNTERCSTSQGWVEGVVHSVTVDYQFMSDPDWAGPEPEKKGGSGTMRFTVIIPHNKLAAPSPPVIACRCEPPVPPEPPKTGMIPGGNFGDGEYAHVDQGGKKRVITGTELASVVKNIVCNDMNTATITVAAMPDAKVVVPAGWELECIEGNGQNVQLQEDLEVAIAAEERTLFVSLRPLASKLNVDKTVRTLCLEIDAPEPRPGMKYRLVPPTNPKLSRLARITRRSSFKGPLDQVRLWIATDFASHAKVSKMLLPAPREAQYLREMWRAASVGVIDSHDKRVQDLMEEKLLLAEGGDPAAVKWCVESKLSVGDKSLVPWLAQQKESVGKLFAEGPPAADIAIVGAICEALANQKTLESTKAALALLRAVPEPHQPLMSNSMGAAQVAQVLSFTTDAAVATEILEWLETDKPPFTSVIGARVNAALPDSIKSRAKALVGIKKPG